MKVHTHASAERLKTVQFTCDTFAEVLEAVAEYVRNIPSGESRVFAAEYRDRGEGNKQVILYLRLREGE